MSPPTQILSLDNVSFSYPSVSSQSLNLKSYLLKRLRNTQLLEQAKPQKLAVKNVSLTIGRGQRLAIIGSNGAGKTTLLRIAAGLLEPTDGRVVLPMSTLALLGDRAVGLDFDLTGKENCLLLLKAHGLARSQLREAQRNTTFLFGMPDRVDDQVSTYSSGMRVRLQTSILLSCPGSVILCDELLGTADLEFQQRAVPALQARLMDAEALVIATHSRGVARRFCSQAVWLRDGSIAEVGGVDEIWDQYEKSI